MPSFWLLFQSPIGEMDVAGAETVIAFQDIC